MAGFRELTKKEIKQLADQGCSSENWSLIEVAEGFNPAVINQTQFSGKVRLGVFEKTIDFPTGARKQAGISCANIHNCQIGNDVYINQVRNQIANYIIEDDVIIENVDQICVEGESSFGNGIEAAVVNEGGGREIPIFDGLSAQTAYILAFYRHRHEVVEKLRAMIDNYTRAISSEMGLIGTQSKLCNCRMIKNLRIGPFSTLDGAERLENGSINSCQADPVFIGAGVIAKDFIASSGANISDGTIIHKCFIGQATELGKQYSAENSVFFANCGGFHGEACSIFAGPYTVTHHKSTLLIAGLFSFLNAGSGSNQSNHMYKLGPVHQGVVERGCKTTSDSYILWPAKIGAFSVIIGRHYRHSDTSDLPFSYLIESDNESLLIPGVNLRSVGTVRDARKWPKRDKRKDPDKLDLINFKLLCPYTIDKMIRGRELLINLREISGHTSESFTYHSCKINTRSMEKGITYYQWGIDKFLGNCLIKRLEGIKFENIEQLQKALKPDSTAGASGSWMDIAGLFAPEEVVEGLLGSIERGEVDTLEKLRTAWQGIYDKYPEYEWNWAAAVLEKVSGKTIDTVTAEDIVSAVRRWKNAVISLDNRLYADAKKEFTAIAQIGFGVDGDTERKALDFQAVRGTFEDNPFVKDIEKHIESKTALAEDLEARIKPLL